MKITCQQADPTAQKVVCLVQTVQKQTELEQGRGKKQEIDAFRLKALLLLLQERSLELSIQEILSSIHTTDIETTSSDAHSITLRQRISPFPGEDIEVTGTFRRDSLLSETIIPIKESFQLTYTVHQTGFPHPTQCTGFSFSEKWLPQCPALESFFLQQKQIARELLPSGKLYQKAQAQLKLRKQLFQQRDSLFFLCKKLMKSLFTAVDPSIVDDYFDFLQKKPSRFEELGKTHEEIFQIVSPSSLDTPKERYQHAIVDVVQAVGSSFSSFPHQPISDFERCILTSIVYQQLAFIDELQTVPAGVSLDLFEEYLAEQLEEEIALFENQLLSHPCMLQAQQILSTLYNFRESSPSGNWG